MSAIRVAVLGPSGRMGRLVAERVAAASDLELTGLLDRQGCNLSELAGVPVSFDANTALANADVYIDFTTPAATESAADAARAAKVAAVIGTTGLTDSVNAALSALAQTAPVLVASNFSLGVNLLAALTRTAARALENYDAEIVELHHRRKRDAPSGTALTLAKAVATGRDQQLDDVATFARHGEVGARPTGEIGVQAVRGGDIVGEHTVYLIGETERIELTHRASDRALFADGAIAAARWLAAKPAGHYQMADVLGLN